MPAEILGICIICKVASVTLPHKRCEPCKLAARKALAGNASSSAARVAPSITDENDPSGIKPTPLKAPSKPTCTEGLSRLLNVAAANKGLPVEWPTNGPIVHQTHRVSVFCLCKVSHNLATDEPRRQ